MPQETISRNFLSQRNARKAGDALIALAKTPAFPSMTRQQIADSLTGTCGFPVSVGNLNNLSESTEVPLPVRTGKPDPTLLFESRLRATEEAITSLYKFTLTLDNSSPQNTLVHRWLEHIKSLPAPEAPSNAP